MPLLKLWNSLRGRSKEEATPEIPVAAPAKAAKSTGKRRLFGGPHATLCRQPKGLQPQSVLEIGVGDGSRAIAIMQTLRKKSTVDIRYVAIDQFELAGGDLALKDFFRLLREHEIRPQLFPETLESGLRRVANTVGTIDLVLISQPLDQWQNPVTEHLLSRISHPDTCVFFDDGDGWSRYNSAPTKLRRAG